MSCERTDDVGAWVLGALPEDEAAGFAAHLEGCEICRREVAELQMVADTLPLAAVQVAPPPELKARIMASVRAEAEVLEAAGPQADVPATAAPAADTPPAARRPREKRDRAWFRRPLLALRPIPAAFAAAVLIALGVGVGALVAGGGPSERTVQAQVTPAASGGRASLTVTGDRATLNVRDFPAPPSGRVYQVWLKRPGRAAPVPTDALFDVRDGSATVEVPGGVDGVDQVLVTDEPNGGSPAPTRTPVVVARPA